MPEPIVEETGFVPGDNVEVGTPVVAEGEPTALDIGRAFTDALLGRITTPNPLDSSESPSDNNESTETTQEQASPSTSTASSGETSSEEQPQGKFYTDEELARYVQAENDRRETARKRREQRQQNQNKLNQLRQAGDYEGFVRETDRQQQEEVSAGQRDELMANLRRDAMVDTLTVHDRIILDPIVTRLPREEVESLLAAVQPVGMEGRSQVLVAAVDRLIQKARADGAADAERALRNNAAFRKQILLEGRETEEEPELIPSRGRTPAPADMNEFVRGLVRR